MVNPEARSNEMNEIHEELNRHRRSDLAEDFDISVNNLVIWEIANATKAERNARTQVTRTETSLAKAERSLGWVLERPNRMDFIQSELVTERERRIHQIEWRLERKVRKLAEAAHRLRLALAVGEYISAEEED
jgi:hypothetical protein